MSVDQITGQSGAAMVRDYMGRSSGPWVSVFSAIAPLFTDAAQAAGKPAPHAAALAASQALPDGNHGENLKAPQA